MSKTTVEIRIVILDCDIMCVLNKMKNCHNQNELAKLRRKWFVLYKHRKTLYKAHLMRNV